MEKIANNSLVWTTFEILLFNENDVPTFIRILRIHLFGLSYLLSFRFEIRRCQRISVQRRLTPTTPGEPLGVYFVLQHQFCVPWHVNAQETPPRPHVLPMPAAELRTMKDPMPHAVLLN